MEDAGLANAISAVRDAEACGPEIALRLASRRIAVFLDYDGTLTPIVERPEGAALPRRTRDVVAALATRCPVAIVSGRERADIERLLGLDSLIYAGSHGFDIASARNPGLRLLVGMEKLPLLREAAARLRGELGAIPGGQIESKALSIAVHFRRAPSSTHAAFAAAVDRLLAAYPELRVTPGKMVFEIQPRMDWNKGRAVSYLLSALGLDDADVVPFYLGDDITDEDAFRALEGRGIRIIVQDAGGRTEDRATEADYRLRDPAAVAAFLDTLAR